jgi:hypothetical protein
MLTRDERHKDGNWRIVANESGTLNWDQVHAALLMDIRDELKRLNARLHCYRVDHMVEAIGRIDRRLRPKRKLKK